MQKAVLRFEIGSSVDETNGIVSGCRLAELNRLAVFAGENGEKKEILITESLVNDILGLANQTGRLDAYWTHDRLIKKDGADHLHDSIGVWRNFRKDENGNPIADLHLEPSDYRERVLWKAKNDPQGIMTSLVFGYTGGRDNASAKSLTSGDLVRFGASTSALLSAYPETEPTKTMDIQELLAALDDPKIKDAIKAVIKSHKDESDGAEKAASDEAMKAETEVAEAAMKDAGVTDADKKPEDAKLSLAARCIVQLNRATLRKLEAAKEETAVLAEARLSTKIGSKEFKIATGKSDGETAAEKFNAKVAELEGKGVKKQAAVMAVMSAHPDLYEETQRAIFAKPVKL